MALPDRNRLIAAQHRSRALSRDWRASPGHRRAVAAFAGLDDAPAEEVATAAEELIGDDAWPAAMLAPLITALTEEPWVDPPLRASRDALRIGAVLFETPAVAISASVVSADILATLPPPATVIVPGRLSVARYWQAGGAKLRRWQVPVIDDAFSAMSAPACEPIEPLSLADGMMVRIDGRTTAQLFDGATADIVAITATIRRDTAPFMREYALGSGALVRVAALDEAASRTQMLLAFLRHAGRGDAGDCFDAASRDRDFSLRWQAMREWIALDARAALPRLSEMAHDPHPEIRVAAAQTLDLVERRLGAPCPA